MSLQEGKKSPSHQRNGDASPSNGTRLVDVGDSAAMDAPPAYSEHHDQFQLSQAGFAAGAAVTDDRAVTGAPSESFVANQPTLWVVPTPDDGRVNININQTSSRFTDLLIPALRTQTLPQEKITDLPPSYIPPSLGGLPGQAPPPKLNVVVQIVGSRGDVQPFVALGKVLKDTYGHRVRIATHPTFKSFVEENGLEFFSIGGDPAELMAFMVKHPGLMVPFEAIKDGEVKKRRMGIEEILLGCWRSCIEAGDGSGPPPQMHKPNEPLDERFFVGSQGQKPFVADAIIANPPSFAHIHIAEKLGIPLHMMFTMPWSPTKAFPHPLANIQSSNATEVMTNYVSYTLVEMMTWQGLGDVINRFRLKTLDLEPLSLIWAPGLLARLRIPTTYCWSPALIPKPNDWNPEISISGFYFLNLASSYTPEPDLAAFLADGPPPVYIGFGSIVVDDPNALTKMIFEAVTKTGVRALVSKGWGGIGADSIGIPDGVFMLGNCPHDWLFQHVSCVVHHGGAGTTAAGIKLGKPTVVVPFFGDQPFWGSMIARAGAGPEPVPYKKLDAESLAAAIRKALEPATLAKAKELGEKIREEQGCDVGGKSFHDFLDTDNLRCSLAPSRVAVWRVRRSKVKLSALAAAVLLEKNIIEQSDLKLYRAKEYTTEGQPWDPISAVTAALIGDVGTIAMTISDVPRELFKSRKKGPSTPGTPSAEGKPQADAASIATPTTAVASSASTSAVSIPNLTLSGPEYEKGSTSEENISGSGAVSPGSPQPPTPARTPEGQHQNNHGQESNGTRSQSPGVTVQTAIDTGKGVVRIVDAGFKTPMNFCLGLARGFRNAPRLYNDDSVRAPERVTDLSSGLKVAGKEFGLGLYDGISGLITQPLKGAQKEGGVGAIKGFGKGIGGIVLKPAAAFWSIPAYTMQGVNAEIRTMWSKSWQNYIIASRLAQGRQDLTDCSYQEREDITLRWNSKNEELKGYFQLKHKSRDSQKGARSPSAIGPASPGIVSSSSVPPTAGPSTLAEPPKTGFWHTRKLSFEKRKQLHAQKEAWKRGQAGGAGGSSAAPPPQANFEDEELERAIRESVKQTSNGDPEEDVRIEQAIRQSVSEMHRPENNSGKASLRYPEPAATAVGAQSSDDISDEQYQALIEEAVRQSLQSHNKAGDYRNKAIDDGEDDDEQLRLAIKQSIEHGQTASYGGGETDQDLKRALYESEAAHWEQQRRDEAARTEEEVVLEYIKKQSLAEGEYARKGKGPAAAAASVTREDEEHDEDLKRALEESLKMSSGRPGGSSGQ
ncbi:uncharacterized protein PgNI_00355 [Pyricularia grisea]|uniref:Glycosyltransferase family 28 N-terminal domain-containing protein n=1 Tax=Pyricularia grisea TaxID=148305 RepID=A0A6P8BJS3_PYRGI|nr:uncharacterized protein PgNI_00355 [Pyricularia grisea]TLD17038.1 hypothetical protein PgNI_00355 [Pyricularia grisea]